MCDTHACPLRDVRTKLVFGAGNANADLMFVGEAPGAQEDQQGLPFVGRAGQLLNQLLGEIGIQRSDVFITNAICCRPPGNRDPLPEEIDACKPYLYRKIELIEPKVICTLGNFATKLLTGNPTGITKVHGRPQEREVAGRIIQLFPLFHPAAALRTDSVKQLLREDLAKLPALIAEAPAEESEPIEDVEQLGLFQ
jgi:DNA polymerase